MRPFRAVANRYPSSLAAVPHTAAELARQLARYPLHFLPIKNHTVEYELELPSFVYTFHRHLTPLPTQAQFWEAYLADNAPFFHQRPLAPPHQAALQARVFRAYPSLVRDLHFALFLREQLQHVLYNPQLDVEEGIDVLVAVHGRFFALNLYTHTTRAHDGRQRKQTRHTPFTDVTYLELPLALHGAVQAGQFFLYGPREWRQLQRLWGEVGSMK